MISGLLVKSKIDVSDMFLKGTIMFLVTFIVGFMFGKSSMMLAFVILLGVNTFEKQNLRVQTLSKVIRLILIDTIIVSTAFLASINRWWGIPINMVILFGIIYYFVSPYDQMSYKTFVMLYVFSQYNKITISQFPRRIGLVIFVLLIVLGTSLIKQYKNKALLDPHIGKAWEMLHQQLVGIGDGVYDEELSLSCSHYMNAVAHSIYLTGHRRYLTTYIGKIQFQFYMNISYFNMLIKQLALFYKQGSLKPAFLQQLIALTAVIDHYFKRQITRDEVISRLAIFLEENKVIYGIEEEVVELIDSIYRNFIEMDHLIYKMKDKPYDQWERPQLEPVPLPIRAHYNLKSIRFNFAMRLSIILAISLFLADILGFYKMIWAIIPLVSITAPYYEDTLKKKQERIGSNILAALIVGVVVNLVGTWWINVILLIGGYYLIYAFKDYYRMSFFLTIVSMTLSTYGSNINTLVFYRIMYVIVGATFAELSARVVPYKTEDGIKELILEIDKLNNVLEAQGIASLEGKENKNAIRNIIIHSAVLCEKLYLKNQSYKDPKITDLIRVNTEFCVRIGHKLLR